LFFQREEGDSHKNKAQGEEDGEGFPLLNVISLLLSLAMSNLASHLATNVYELIIVAMSAVV
jgi:hypothetical protein